MNPLVTTLLLAAAPFATDLQAETALAIRAHMTDAMHGIRAEIRVDMLRRNRLARALPLQDADTRMAAAWPRPARQARN